jgi:hypothetical protein
MDEQSQRFSRRSGEPKVPEERRRDQPQECGNQNFEKFFRNFFAPSTPRVRCARYSAADSFMPLHPELSDSGKSAEICPAFFVRRGGRVGSNLVRRICAARRSREAGCRQRLPPRVLWRRERPQNSLRILDRPTAFAAGDSARHTTVWPGGSSGPRADKSDMSLDDRSRPDRTQVQKVLTTRCTKKSAASNRLSAESEESAGGWTIGGATARVAAATRAAQKTPISC